MSALNHEQHIQKQFDDAAALEVGTVVSPSHTYAEIRGTLRDERVFFRYDEVWPDTATLQKNVTRLQEAGAPVRVAFHLKVENRTPNQARHRLVASVVVLIDEAGLPVENIPPRDGIVIRLPKCAARRNPTTGVLAKMPRADEYGLVDSAGLLFMFAKDADGPPYKLGDSVRFWPIEEAKSRELFARKVAVLSQATMLLGKASTVKKSITATNGATYTCEANLPKSYDNAWVRFVPLLITPQTTHSAHHVELLPDGHKHSVLTEVSFYVTMHDGQVQYDLLELSADPNSERGKVPRSNSANYYSHLLYTLISPFRYELGDIVRADLQFEAAARRFSVVSTTLHTAFKEIEPKLSYGIVSKLGTNNGPILVNCNGSTIVLPHKRTKQMLAVGAHVQFRVYARCYGSQSNDLFASGVESRKNMYEDVKTIHGRLYREKTAGNKTRIMVSPHPKFNLEPLEWKLEKIEVWGFLEHDFVQCILVRHVQDNSLAVRNVRVVCEKPAPTAGFVYRLKVDLKTAQPFVSGETVRFVSSLQHADVYVFNPNKSEKLGGESYFNLLETTDFVDVGVAALYYEIKSNALKEK